MTGTIDGLFATQARRTPHAVALVSGAAAVSYGELDRRADRLARRLAAAGVGPEVRVGLCLNRSLDRVIATLAILKAGGVYVPLDPGDPAERLAFLLEDTGAPVVVTAERFRPVLPASGAVLLSLDRQPGSPGSSRCCAGALPATVRADGLAYVMYTSGSTGGPKGVAVRHRGVVRLVVGADYVELGPDEVLLQLAPFSFDASTFEIWGALLNGGRLVVPPAESAAGLSSADLADLLARHGVTVLWLTAGLFHQMVDLDLQGLAPVRQLLAGGDVLSVPHVRRVLAELPGTRLINGYGPTESTTFACCFPIADPAALTPSVPLGFPIARTTVHLLGEDLRPVDSGEPGEIAIGGDGLARGYLDRPERTAERFVPSPFGGRGERLYRTGDLGRRRPSGEIEFLGRLDGQVKVRGYRIEPGEVEAALAIHPGVRQAAVVVREDRPGDKRLAAYFVAPGEDAESLPAAELRAFLAARLPEPMIPAFFLPLAALPLTGNGKVDRRALARLPLPARESGGEPAAPRTPIAELLAGIWEEVLGGGGVGPADRFLDRGGDSLLAARVVARVRTAFGVDLPLSAVLQASDLAGLAERIESALAAGLPPLPPILPVLPLARDGRGEPLSSAQRRLWFLERLVPGTPAYNIPLVMRFDGPLAPAVLARCLVEIAGRHEALRTTFESGEDGEPLQRISPPAPFPLPLADLSGLPPSRRGEERDRLSREEARRPFAQGQGALWRRLLLRIAAGTAGEHHLLVTLHHAIVDGESVQVIDRELAALYPAFLAGRRSPLPPLRVQPADVAAWESRWLTAERLEPHLDYFRQRLAGAPAELDLPADRPRPPVPSWRGTGRSVALPAGLSAALRELSRRSGATPFMTLFAAWVAFLYRATGQDDVVVGTVVARRGRPEIEGLIGFFANTLPLRVALPGDPAFGDLLAATRVGALALYVHQELPIERLTEALRPARTPSATPLFQVFCGLHGNAGERRLAPGLTLSWREEEYGAAQFDLVLDLEDHGGEIAGRLVASADRFAPSTVERMLRGWETLLADAVARPAAPVSELALLGAAERQALLFEWSHAGEPPAWTTSVPARVAAWAAKTPEAIAVLPADPALKPLSYAALVAAAHRLAAELRARGLGPGVRVGVYAERRPETLVGLFAVLLAGGAFLPLDPGYPAERLALLLADARVPVLLARRDIAATLPTGGAALVPLDGAAEPPAAPVAASASPGDVAPGDIAYVIYTSGSTGMPKGVLVPHRGFLGAVEALARRSRMAPGSRVLQFASASFDASVWETWSALLSGSTLVLARREELLPGPPLLATLERRAITNLFLTPSALAALPEEASAGLPALRSLVVGGEAFPPDLVARWAAGRRLWNAYGPTEASICVAMAHLDEDGQSPIVPIGRPVADNRLLVLGRHLEPVPRGAVGELYVGGGALARGYLGRPGLTARAFLPDPFSGLPGTRLYRTGDLARFRSDGQLEFLGRADRQVKIRGFRIEPGEIEAQIAEHPGVREAVVLPYEAGPGDGPSDLRLAAYVVPVDPVSPAAMSSGVLRAFLRGRLPEHLVPAAFVFLPALPLAPSGKIDRRALPLPTSEEAVSGGGTAARLPTLTTPILELLAGIWGEVLGRSAAGGDGIGAIDLIDPDTDFFDLGGHSLLLTRVLSRVRTAFGVELPLHAAFEARTLSALAGRVEEALRDGVPARPPLVRASRERPLPLSFAQQRLWFLDRLEPGSPVYNLPVALRLAGPLDRLALERSLAAVFNRHEALRITFAEGPDGEPFQVVAPFAATALPRVDLSRLPAGGAAEAQRLAIEEGRRPFDLATGPLARAMLLALGADEHHLLFSCHHIAFDGWSVGVLLRELGELYAAFQAGRPSPLPAPPFQYGDFAVWQRGWLAGEALSAQLAYWRERLAGAPAALEIPADRPRPPAQSFRGATLDLPVPAGLAAGLRALARGEGATLFMAALAAFSALLSRFTGQRDLLIGSPVANRTEAGIEELLGFFVNTLALRVDVSGDPPFATLLVRSRESALAAYAYQDLPFDRLVEELQPERDLSRSPLFQVMFALDPVHGGELAAGLSAELLRVDNGTAKFDLSLFLAEETGGLAASLEYATDLFDAPTVSRLARSFLVLLAGLVAEGVEGAVSRLPLLGVAERWQLQGEWNEESEEIGDLSPTCLHDLVTARIAERPAATALVAGEERWTYRDLGRETERLARRLAALGVGPEVRVAVCLERSPLLVTALLAILRAGGVYVPLDPAYPEERLGFMLEDAGAAVVLAEAATAARLPASQACVVVLDGEPQEAHTEAAPLPVLPGNLAYLIYTSGSTGRPKAVAIEHRSAVALVYWALRVFGPSELAATLAATSISFDLSVFELFVPLAAGGTVVLAVNALALPELPAASEVTLVNTVPSAMTELVRAGALPAGVRTVNLAGEPLKGSLAEALYEAGVERVFNLYGPSEDTTYSTFERVERGSRREPTIGRPIAGSRVRLLDRDGETVPVGVPGELYLGGAGLARGYLGRPELTAERFVPDPLGAPGARLYGTGDLARYLPDGRLEYLGRLDHQVKVRGYRIELGEIELALVAHPGVREAVVVARGEPGGDMALAAYFVAPGEPALSTPTPAELRDFLRGRLTPPMVPASFTRLERLPLTPNGKVDRKALPAPAVGGPGAGGAEILHGPLYPLVELLAGIWAEVLGRAELPGPHDNFFELGGHSLLATRVVSRIRAALGVELPLRALFAAPTVAALATRVATLSGPGSGEDEPIAPAADRADLPLSFAQQRLWLLDRLEPGSAVYNLPVAYRIDGPLIPPLFAAALAEVVRRQEVLRTTFAVAADGEPRRVVHPAGPVPLPVVDLAGLPPHARAAAAERLTAVEAGRPFDLASGPLLRAALLRMKEREHRLLVAMHHIATDGWSLTVLLDELAALYRAFAAGLPSPLPELPIQYADFAAWQRRFLAGPVLGTQLDYWRRQLARAPAALDLPTDRPRPAVETSRGSQITLPLPPALAAGVRALARRQGATLFMVLLSGFAALLERYTGEADLLLGTPVAGRGRREIEKLIGFFVNTLVLRVDLAFDPGFAVLLARVREMALAAYAHEDLPFERLVEELQPERSLARSPLFQVSFTLGVEAAVRELAPGLPLAPLAVENGTAKYDLTLGFDSRGEALLATLEYRTDLFDRVTVVRWAGHLGHLLGSAVADPGVPLSRLDLLAAPERHQLLAEWNDTRVPPAAGPLVHQLVAAHARRAPAAPAVISGERRLLYGELDRRSDRLARALRALGCGPEVRVGLCLERSPELVIAALAVLKAGGAFVPLDPAYPAERLDYQLEDSEAPILLTRRGPIADRVAERGIHCLFPHEDEARLPAAAVAAGDLPAPALSPDHLAYVIYTSGSSGLPKAVEIPHAGLLSLVRWHQRLYGVTAEDRATLVASPAFDASVWEVWPYLAAGASLHLPDEETRLSPSRMLRFWAEEEITLSFLMTPLAERVLEEAVPPDLDLRLRALITGGDRLHRRPAAGAPYRLMNHYGPSEYSVVTTLSAVAPLPAGSGSWALPTLGRPIDDTRVYLLDWNGQPVPAGVAGELHVTGRGLARGYQRRPDLTAERFVPDPWSAELGGRLYRTGDLACYLADGEIDFLGRIDHQVKVRGFRIELGEVEAALASHPGVERAVAATHAFGPEDRRLVAWVVPAPGELTPAEVKSEALRAWVGRRLPEFMVPAVVVVLAALPLTPNGKVDRRALPPPTAPERRPPSDPGPPRSPLEELVAGFWAELLGGGTPGLGDDFFAAGGHSLLATRLLGRLRAATGVDLPLRALFAHPTVAALAAEVERALRAPGAPPLPPIEPGLAAASGGEAPASSGQERLWYFHQLDPGGVVLNVPHPLDLHGPLSPAALRRALAEIARRHASLRTVFVYGDEGLRQRIAPPGAAGALPLPLVDLEALAASRREAEARRLTVEEARQPFDLAAGPLWRARLLRLGAAEHRLLASFHHSIADGWSADLFDRELAALYGGGALPEPALQYADFAVWERRWLNQEALAPQLAYWRRQLAGMPPALELPADRPRPARQSFRGAARYLPLPPALSAGVQALGRREGSTLFITAFAAFAALLGRYTGRADIVLGAPAANRHRPGTEGLFGFFVDNLVLRLDLTGDPTFRQLLTRAREVALGAYAHPDVPFDRLVEELDPARDKSRHPLVQVLLSVQTAAEPLRFGGPSADLSGDLSAVGVDVHTGTSQFDLTLFFTDSPRGLTLAAEYATDLFSGETIETMLTHLAALLEAVVAAPDLPLSLLPAEIAPRPRPATIAADSSAAPAEAVGPAEPAAPSGGTPEDDLARRQAALAERRARLAASQQELLASRLRRGK